MPWCSDITEEYTIHIVIISVISTFLAVTIVSWWLNIHFLKKIRRTIRTELISRENPEIDTREEHPHEHIYGYLLPDRKDSSCQTERRQVHFDDDNNRYYNQKDSSCQTERRQVHFGDDNNHYCNQRDTEPLVDTSSDTSRLPSAPVVPWEPVVVHTPPPTNPTYHTEDPEAIEVVVEIENPHTEARGYQALPHTKEDTERTTLITQKADKQSVSYSVNQSVQINHLEACSEVLIEKISRIEKRLKQNNI